MRERRVNHAPTRQLEHVHVLCVRDEVELVDKNEPSQDLTSSLTVDEPVVYTAEERSKCSSGRTRRVRLCIPGISGSSSSRGRRTPCEPNSISFARAARRGNGRMVRRARGGVIASSSLGSSSVSESPGNVAIDRVFAGNGARPRARDIELVFASLEWGGDMKC
jgi:hypothetical protein